MPILFMHDSSGSATWSTFSS